VASEAAVKCRLLDQAEAKEISGRFVESDRKTLLVALHEWRPSAHQLPLGTRVELQFALGEHHYRFGAACVTPALADPWGAMRLGRPSALFVGERRRSPRRRLRRPTCVFLLPDRDPEAWRCRATMLNVSSDGLACRAPAQFASLLLPDNQVWVRFALDGVEREFALAARVVNVTEGGFHGQRIIGLEFNEHEANRLERDRLREALDFPVDARGPQSTT
jgi:hypothetical protein